MARRRSVLVVGLVILLGALGTAMATVALHLSTRGWIERAFTEKQEAIAAVVTAELVQYRMTLADLAASLGAQPRLTADAFAAVTAPLNPDRLPGATEVSFVVPGTAATAPDVQARWRERGSAGLTLEAVPGAGERYFAVLGRPLAGGPSGLGADLSRTGEIAAALRRARPGTEVAASTAFGADPHLLMAAAVHGGDGRFRGWVTMTYRGQTFLGTPVGFIGGDQVSSAFADISGARPIPLTSWQPDAEPYTGLPAITTDLPQPQPGHWRLTVRPTERLLPAAQDWLVPGAAAGGTLITGLLAMLAATVVTSRDRALRRVDQATAELREDIDRREAVEQQLRRREEELTGFAGVVAHDLRSPLASVLGFAEMLASATGEPLSDKQRAHLTRLQGSATRMQHLIDDLLAYATADNTAPRITEINLNELVDSVLAERLGAGGATVAKIDCADLPRVLGDPGQIRQVLDNYLGNAIKYTPKDRPAQISVRAAETESTLCRIEVADRGIGIPEHQRGEVFNAFTRAEGSERYQGTGLGLAIVQRIVERHGGEVGVDANPGGGSIFWFTLPTPLPLPGPGRSRDGDGESRSTFAGL